MNKEADVIYVEDLLESDDPVDQIEGKIMLALMERLGLDEIDPSRLDVKHTETSYPEGNLLVETKIEYKERKNE
jgi:hypothetical protein